jgi:hypothetical protein
MTHNLVDQPIMLNNKGGILPRFFLQIELALRLGKSMSHVLRHTKSMEPRFLSPSVRISNRQLTHILPHPLNGPKKFIAKKLMKKIYMASVYLRTILLKRLASAAVVPAFKRSSNAKEGASVRSFRQTNGWPYIGEGGDALVS